MIMIMARIYRLNKFLPNRRCLNCVIAIIEDYIINIWKKTPQTDIIIKILMKWCWKFQCPRDKQAELLTFFSVVLLQFALLSRKHLRSPRKSPTFSKFKRIFVDIHLVNINYSKTHLLPPRTRLIKNFHLIVRCHGDIIHVHLQLIR